MMIEHVQDIGGSVRETGTEGNAKTASVECIENEKITTFPDTFTISLSKAFKINY